MIKCRGNITSIVEIKLKLRELYSYLVAVYLMPGVVNIALWVTLSILILHCGYPGAAFILHCDLPEGAHIGNALLVSY